MKSFFLSIIIFTFQISLFASNGRYRLILTDNPATTIMIGWDQISGENPTVYYGTIDNETDWSAYAFSKEIDRLIDFKGMQNTFAKLSNLTPETNYYFVIKDSDSVSERFWFKTAPNTNKKLSFIAGGDSRNNRIPRQNANKLVSKIKPTAIFFGGDMTSGDSDNEWREWLDDWQLTTATDGRMFPILPARGNHEFSNNSIYNLFNTASPKAYYAISFGKNLYTLYTLNSEIPCGGYQYQWLKKDLEKNNSIWKSAQYHKPMRPHVSGKPEGNDEYQNWATLFYNQQVRLIFESDSHDVKTTWPIRPCLSRTNCEEGFIRDDANGSVYVGEGGWGAPLRTSDDAKTWTRDSGSFNQFKWICVSENQIIVKTVVIENPIGVSENNNDSICELPEGLNIWNPSNGEAVIINKNESDTPKLKITSPKDGEFFFDGSEIDINIDYSTIDAPINSIAYKVDHTLIGLVESAPYNMTYNFNEGLHIIEAIAIYPEGLYYKDSIQITVATCSDKLINRVVNEDVEESEEGFIYKTSSDLELVYDSYNSQGNQVIGLHFDGICIPKEAVINEAFIQFTADGDSSNETELLIFAELDADALSYNEGVVFDVSERSYSSSIYWKPKPWSDSHSGLDQRTPDLSTQIQQIISIKRWEKNNAMAFKIEGLGFEFDHKSAIRKAKSKEGKSPPILHINYTIDNKDSDGEFKVYPNPVNDFLHFKLPSTSNKHWKVDIFSVSGKRIVSKTIIDNKISIKQITSGNYIIKVYETEKTIIFTEKISINKR